MIDSLTSLKQSYVFCFVFCLFFFKSTEEVFFSGLGLLCILKTFKRCKELRDDGTAVK